MDWCLFLWTSGEESVRAMVIPIDAHPGAPRVLPISAQLGALLPPGDRLCDIQPEDDMRVTLVGRAQEGKAPNRVRVYLLPS